MSHPNPLYPHPVPGEIPTPPLELCAWKRFGVVLAPATTALPLAWWRASLVEALVTAGFCYCFCALLMAVLFCQGKASGVFWPCPKAAWRKMPLCVPRQSGTCKNHLRMPREELCPGWRSGCQKGELRGQKQHGLLWAFLVTVALKAEIFLVVTWSEMWLLKWWL